MSDTQSKVSPIIAIAAGSVIVFSAVGVGVMTGLIPSSFSNVEQHPDATKSATAAAPAAPVVSPPAATVTTTPAPAKPAPAPRTAATAPKAAPSPRSEERRVGKSVDLGGRRMSKKKKTRVHK